jgi:hypothetical protein|tara:strand:- start:386 stop:565 length:180 start_codon:yes stop_codon:yes gene_type:complete
MYHLQMDTVIDGWVIAWEGAKYPFYSDALMELDLFLMEVKQDGLDYSREDYRIKFIGEE